MRVETVFGRWNVPYSAQSLYFSGPIHNVVVVGRHTRDTRIAMFLFGLHLMPAEDGLMRSIGMCINGLAFKTSAERSD